MDRKLKKLLKGIVGAENFSEGEAERSCYSYDATRLQSQPELVVWAETTDQVAGVLRLANEHRIPVFPRGAGTGFTGGSIPTEGGIALCLTKMNRIKSIDAANLVATVEPGVVNADLRKAVENKGLFYPPDPASLNFSTMGGNVAECAGGPTCVKYGVTRNYVLGLEVVLPTGETIRVGRSLVKNVAGYDLVRLFCGSEGTLGVITEINLRLIPLPEAKTTIMAVFPSVAAAAKTVARTVESRILPSALEFMDQTCIQAVERHTQMGLPTNAGAILIIEADGPARVLADQRQRIESICKECGAVSVESADDENAREELWKARRALSPAVSSLAPRKINEDVGVPPSRIPELLRRVDEVAREMDLIIANFGHAGDGNIHVNILYDPEIDGMQARAEKASARVFEAALELDGTITGEHGIGITKVSFLERQLGRTQLELMRGVKRVFDPNNILNPGKIF
ncbi:MAG TPA: FAD-linked oxidase C-terminal domain-containing protein [bacterium]|nr:FAD-linked oxidase C-terminal domain-containing protein [bacterium]